MKKFLKGFSLILIPAILFIAVMYFYEVKQDINKSSTKDSIEYISKHFNASGKLIDYQNDLGVKTVEDIKFFLKGDKVEIHFGKILLNWRLKDFVSKENQEELKKVFINIYRDAKTGKIRVFYKGEEVERWVS